MKDDKGVKPATITAKRPINETVAAMISWLYILVKKIADMISRWYKKIFKDRAHIVWVISYVAYEMPYYGPGTVAHDRLWDRE